MTELMNNFLAVLVTISGLAAIPFFIHETVRRRQALKIGDVRYRREVLPFWINKKWTANYKAALKFTNKAFAEIAAEKLKFFPIIAVSYTALGFFASWTFLGNGSFLSLPVLPIFPDGSVGVLLRILTVAFIAITIKYYKEIYIYQQRLFESKAGISAVLIIISLAVILVWANAGVLFFFAWLILAMGSPLAMFVASILIAVSTKVEFTGVQMLLLYLVMVSALNYVTTTNTFRNVIAVICVFTGGVYTTFFSSQSIANNESIIGVTTALTSLLGQLDNFPLAVIFLYLAFFLLCFRNIVLVPLSILFGAMLLTFVLSFVAYSILAVSEKAFPNNDLCYPFSRELLGAVAVVILIPFVNSIFDFASFGLTRLTLGIHQTIGASIDKPRMLFSSLLISDAVITFLLIGGLIYSLFYSISWYESIIRLDTCSPTEGAQAALNGITEKKHFWLVFVILTTVFWSLYHLTIVVIATFKFHAPDTQRLFALKHLSSSNQDHVKDDQIATWHADAFVKAAGVATSLGALIIYLMYKLPFRDYIPWVFEITKRSMANF